MKKVLLALAAVGVLAAPTAQAGETIRVHDVNNFVADFTNAINEATYYNTRNDLDNLVSNQAVFEDNINNHHNSHLVNGYYNDYYYGYRYPYHTYYSNVGFRSDSKWEKINQFEAKKRTIPGYKAALTVENVSVTPNGKVAVVDVDMKEQSVTYSTAYHPYYYNHTYLDTRPLYHYSHANLNTHSKCKLHLEKMGDRVWLTRMYCNTNTNLPL